MKNWRYSLFTAVILLIGLIITARLYYLQVIRNQYYRVAAEKEHTYVRELYPRRGLIYTAEEAPLVLNRIAYQLFAEPIKVKDPGKTAALLSKILNDAYPPAADSPPVYPTASLRDKISQKFYWVSLARRLPPEIKEKISELNLAGIGFEEEAVRFYPEGETASYLLGFVGFTSQGGEQGYYGLEGYYNGELQGRPGELFEERAASGRPMVVGNYRRRPAEDGAALILTVSREIQHLLETKLAEAVKRYGAKSASAVVMDPLSGAVLGMASQPNYNPARYGEILQRQKEKDDSAPFPLDYTNPAIGESYEPGSVIKALTLSAALEEKLIKPQTTFEDTGPLVIAGYVVDNWDKKHHGRQTMIELLQKSNNIGAAAVGRMLGAKMLSAYFRKFGLGSITGIDLEGESSGIVKNDNQWGEIDLATAAFGQGISVTPLQLVQSFAAIANGGFLVKPHVVSEVRDERGAVALQSGEKKRIISEETAEVMTEMLTAAVEGGEAKFAVLKSHRIAGKTGTAQIPVGGKYDPSKTNATFIGFFTDRPKFVLLVKVAQPSSSIYAAETAAPLWMEIARDLSVIFRIAPDR